MANRYDLLDRLAIALSRPGVDGVLGTPDIIDDLAALGLLDDKIIVGSMNRGGLRGASFEMDDRYTGYDVDSMVDAGIDFAKALIRVNLDDDGTAPTLQATAAAVTQAARRTPADHARAVHESPGRTAGSSTTCRRMPSSSRSRSPSGLGSSSAYTWLKLPVVEDMERVMEATTMPTLLLGGDSGVDPDETFASWEDALALPGVRGLTVGRTLLYPPDGDVAGAVDTAAALVHRRHDPRHVNTAPEGTTMTHCRDHRRLPPIPPDVRVIPHWIDGKERPSTSGRTAPDLQPGDRRGQRARRAGRPGRDR